MLRIAWILVATTPFTMACGTSSAQEKEAISFEKAVLPIFQAKCLSCHGDKKQRAMLDLRTKASIVKGGESGAALKPGSLKGSLLWDKIRTDEMPESEQKLTP